MVGCVYFLLSLADNETYKQIVIEEGPQDDRAM